MSKFSIDKKHNFKRFSKKDLFAYCRLLFKKRGENSINYATLESHGNLYWALYAKNITMKDLVDQLGLSAAYRKAKKRNFYRVVNGKVQKSRTWIQILKEIKDLENQIGFVPSAPWLQANKRSDLVGAVYSLGKKWDDVYKTLGMGTSSKFVKSRSGIRWLSIAEACLSNFLNARGIKHGRGHKYPTKYNELSGRKYGYYDLYFFNKKGQSVDVEVWGEIPMGKDQLNYQAKKKSKEKFNRKRDSFIGINFRDCYVESKLEAILLPFIGNKKKLKYQTPHDHLVHSVHWSTADELIEFCRDIALKQRDGAFPTEEWLRKRGTFRNRKGDAYNTLAIYIRTKLGGMRNLRKILGQEHSSTYSWSKELALQKCLMFYKKYRTMPYQARSIKRSGAWVYTTEEYKMAVAIEHACRKYIGSNAKIQKVLNISPQKPPKGVTWKEFLSHRKK